MIRATACFVAALIGIASAPAAAETRALLIGVSDYQSPDVRDLTGPANDLGAMEALARGMGASDLVTLRDGAAKRSSVEGALQQLGARSRPGDWVLLYFSGHGAQALAKPGSGPDRYDQFVLLSGFDPLRQDPEDFIVDKDFYVWLKRYMPADVRILMMVDSCHSGSMHRAIDPRTFAYSSRLYRSGDGRAIELVARPGPRLPPLRQDDQQDAPVVTREDLPNLAYLGAARDDQLALETELPQEGAPQRGVLTFAFEQGLTMPGRDEGSRAADLDGDGRITLLELSSYLNSQVRLLSAHRQDSTASFPSAWAELPVFSALPAPRPSAQNAPPAVAIASAAAPMSDVPAEGAWRIAPSVPEADFVWDVQSREVIRRSGDVIANDVGSSQALAGVIEKWDVVQSLRPLMSELTHRLAVDPEGSDYIYGPGTPVKLSLVRTGRAAASTYATVFNLASDGTVQLLFPLAPDGDGRLRAGGKISIIETEVAAPFGVDHIFALTTPNRPDELVAALRSADGQRAAGRLTGLIRKALRNGKGQVSLSIAELYTGPTR
jgi:hypothetical protein